ncbi:MAG TPA: hypothetical protein VFE31_12965 [Opitutaceae bacterium]|nr:hypothetical protein [Opitutaceae bacterium]
MLDNLNEALAPLPSALKRACLILSPARTGLLLALLGAPASAQTGGGGAAIFRSLPPVAQGSPVQPALAANKWTAAILAGLPKYDPSRYLPPRPEGADHDPNVIRMPKVIVHALKMPAFTERQLYTKSALAQLAVKRYFGPLAGLAAPFGLFKGHMEARAMAEYDEDERLSKIAALKDTTDGIILGGDAKEAKALNKLIEETFVRPSDWMDTIPHHHSPRW